MERLLTNVRGRVKSISLFGRALQLHFAMTKLEAGDAANFANQKKQTISHLKKADEHYKKVRIQRKAAAFRSTLNKRKAPNAKQKKRGIDWMPIVNGRVPYSKLQKDDHRGQIEIELRAQGIAYFE